MVKQWYVTIEGEQKGPLTDAEIRQWVGNGKVSEENFVRLGPEGEWQPAGDYQELFGPVQRAGALPAKNDEYCPPDNQNLSVGKAVIEPSQPRVPGRGLDVAFWVIVLCAILVGGVIIVKVAGPSPLKLMAWAFTFLILVVPLALVYFTRNTPHPKIGGWLLFFCVALTMLSPMTSVPHMVADWRYTKPLFEDFPAIKTAMIWENTGAAIVLATGFIAGCIIWSGSPHGRLAAKTYLLVRLFGSFVFNLIGIAQLSEVSPEVLSNVQDYATRMMFYEFIFFGIWWLYFLKSKRVRSTYGDTGQASPESAYRQPADHEIAEASRVELGEIGVIEEGAPKHADQPTPLVELPRIEAGSDDGVSASVRDTVARSSVSGRAQSDRTWKAFVWCVATVASLSLLFVFIAGVVSLLRAPTTAMEPHERPWMTDPVVDAVDLDGQVVVRLFEQEIPEIRDGIIEIRAIARLPGDRTKVAVFSNDERIDCIGACVGMGGNPIKKIVNRLDGERVDLVRYNDNIQVFIENALQPAEIDKIILRHMSHRAIVHVREDQLSLALGRRDRTVRLASKLCGWDIQITTSK